MGKIIIIVTKRIYYMKKTLTLLLVLAFAGTAAFAAVGKETKGPFGYNLWEDINRPAKGAKVAPQQQQQQQTQGTKKQSKSSNRSQQQVKTQTYVDDGVTPEWETEKAYYDNPTMKGVIIKYKKGNYSGCLQEAISLTKKTPSNPLVYYYMGMAYAQVGNNSMAVKAYNKAISIGTDQTVAQYATKGRDCLTGGPACVASQQDGGESENVDDLDRFINAPYGNGFSDELYKKMREEKLKNIQKTINGKEDLEIPDIQKIQDFDQNKSELEDGIKIAEASEEDILNAIKTLKEAGVNVTVSPVASTMPNQYNELSMMLGTQNNNNSAMNMMIPYMLSQQQNGQSIDPQVMQAMMMNSMIPDFTFSDNDKRY